MHASWPRAHNTGVLVIDRTTGPSNNMRWSTADHVAAMRSHNPPQPIHNATLSALSAHQAATRYQNSVPHFNDDSSRAAVQHRHFRTRNYERTEQP